MRKTVWLFVLVLMILFTANASAATLTFPSSLTTIEEEAFAGDTSLDAVILGNSTQVVGSRAFAESSIKQITIPNSVRLIADNAFEGIETLTITAAEGSYGYGWAVKNGYIRIPAATITSVIMPSTLQAGMNLEVQVFGPTNTVSHTVFLINNATKKGETRWIREQNGIVSWEGYNLENGSYTVKVYTVTDDYSGTTPVSRNLVISGTRPAGPENIELPEKIGWDSVGIGVDPYDKLLGEYSYYDEEGNLLDSYVDSSWEEEKIIRIWRGYEEAVRLDVSFRSYKDGLWSEWSSIRSIELVNNNYNPDRPQLKSLTIPESIPAGRDFEISFECEEGVSSYEIWIEDENGYTIMRMSDSYSSPVTMIVPGYKTEAGTYRLYINTYDGDDWYTVVSRDVIISDGRIPATITLTADKDEAYINQSVELSIMSNGTEGAYIKIVGDRTTYKGCNLQEDGSGTCNTTLDVLYSETKSKAITLSSCVFLGDSWSAWSEPITVNVSRPEPLPVPVITVSDSYETGEDIVVGLDGVEDADYYYVDLIEYFSGESVINRYYYKNDTWSNFGEDVVFSGSQFGSGTYQIRVRAYSYVRQSSSVTKTVKVSGTRAPAPSVSCDPDEFRINQTTTFTIDTTDCEEIYLRYNGYGNQYSWSDSRSIVPTSDSTAWTYRFSNEAEDANFVFTFTAKKNGKWTSSKDIRKTVLGLPPLAQAVIHIDEEIEAGKDFSIVVDPVANATSYRYTLDSSDNYSYGNLTSVGEYRYNGYDIEPGLHTIRVWAYSDDYATSISEKTFTITGSKAPAPMVTVDKIEAYTDETFTFTIDTTGATLVYSRDIWWNQQIISVTGNSTQWSSGGWSAGEWYCQFALLKDGKWTSWTNPITVQIKERPRLANPVVHVNETINAGEDLTFQFETVNEATSYTASFSYPYDGTRLYSWNSETALPDTELTVPGYLISSGNYVLTVTAKADGYKSTSKTVYVSASGNRASGPSVTIETPLRIKRNAIFIVDTTGAEDLQVKYQFTSENNWWSEQRINVPVTGDSTELSLPIDEYKQGVNLTISFAAKVNGKWSNWKTNTYTIEGLPPLDPAVIHVNDTIEAGTNFNVSVDPVENATNYWYGLYLPNGNTYNDYSSTKLYINAYNGYNFEPGEYTVKVWAYSDDYASSESEKAFTIVGEKAPAPTVTVDKTEFYSNETSPVITITAQGAEAIRCNGNTVLSPDDEGIATYSPYMYIYDGDEREYQYRFCAVVNDVWTAWSEPVKITIKKVPEPEPLDNPTIHLPDAFAAGQDFTFSFDPVVDATSYQAYVTRYYTDSNVYSSSSVTPGTDITVSGRQLTAGRYIAMVYAYADGRKSSSSQIEFRVTGDRGDAPDVTTDKDDYTVGETMTFSIDTAGVEEVYVSYSTTGNHGTSGYRTITPEADITEWNYSIPGYFYGTTYNFIFNVKREGVWSKPKAITIAIPNNQ